VVEAGRRGAAVGSGGGKRWVWGETMVEIIIAGLYVNAL